MKRTYGSGHLYVKSGAYYVRWRTADGRHPNRRLGKVRSRGEKDGLTRAQAERLAHKLVDAESVPRSQSIVDDVVRTVDDVADALRDRLLIEGARLSYRQNCASMQRVHISPRLGKRRVETVTSR